MSRKFGDRRDAKRIKMSGFDKILYFLKKKRSESEVYISRDIDVTNLVKYMEKKKKEDEKITYFHLFSMALAKVVYNNPYLNRFIIGGHKYQRNDVSISFVAKTEFSDDAEELMKVVKIAEDDDMNTLSLKIRNDVKKIRSNNSNGADNLVKILGCLPNFLMRIVVWFVKLLDNHDMLPKSLMDEVVYYSTVLVSNLGSIHCDGIYHNLTDFGTTSAVCTIGEITKKPMIVSGKVEIRDVCNFGICLDERIADGVYFAKSINMLEYILANPELLEDKASDKIVIDRSK